MSRLLFWSLALLTAVILFACPADDDIPSVPCENKGYERIDGDCICPEGNFSAYNHCRTLRVGEYFGVSSECPCVDSLFLWLEGINDEGEYEFKFNDNVFDSRNFDTDYLIVKSRTKSSFVADLIFMPGGDSIASQPGSNSIRCNIPGSQGEIMDKTVFYGRFSPTGDTIFAKFVYLDGINPTITLDSCNVLFRR